MKVIYSILLSILGFSIVYGQTSLPQVNPVPMNGNLVHTITKKTTNQKTTNCTDTIQYPSSKLSGLPEIDTMEITNYISGVAQAYHLTSPGNVDGVSAYIFLDNDGVPGNSSPITMTIKLYNIDANNDITTMIDSADVQVLDVGFAAQTLLFTGPIAVSDSFAVAIEINPMFPANPYYVTNVSANGDGNGEKLSSAEYLGVWYNAFDDFAGWDMDVMLEPIFTHNISSSFTTDVDSICPNNQVVFTNGSSVNMDAMFNQYDTVSNHLYSWDFDDGMGTHNVQDTSYNFGTPGTYNVDLTTGYYGYTANCFDTAKHTIVVYDTAVAAFTFGHLGGGNYQFTNASTGAMTYSWDFGDGSPLDPAENPTHTYASPNNYTVCLTVTDSNGCNVDSVCQMVSFVAGIDDIDAPNYIQVYPIPAHKNFNVKVPVNYYGGKVIVSDVLGKVLKQVSIEQQTKVQVLTEGISSGIYFVSVDYEGERVFTKRIAIDN